MRLLAGMKQRLNDIPSDDESCADADLLAFNVEMGMVPMSSLGSAGALATDGPESHGVAVPRPRRARLNSHSVPLSKSCFICCV